MDEILPKLWIGDHNDALSVEDDPNFINICVLEDEALEYLPTGAIRMPVLSDEDEEGGLYTTPKTLNKIAGWIDRSISRGKHVLVSCGAGMERSPLAVAWYISRKLGITLKESYDWVKKRRSVAQDCSAWIRYPSYDERNRCV